MVISRLHTDKIERNLSLIQEFLVELKRLSLMTEDEFLSDRRNPAAAESYLRRSIEAVFDIGRHILAKSYGFLKNSNTKALRLSFEKRAL